MIFAMGVSHRDARQLIAWLEYARHLAVLEAADEPKVVVFQTWRAHDLLAEHHAKHGDVRWEKIADENEAGYPKSASHLFLCSLEACERIFPGEPVMWLEPDTLPLRRGWRSAIAAEYASCGKPFMGHIEREHGFPHMAGCGVYPHDWRMRAPRLAGVLDAPDIFWGKGLGQAFDTWGAPEIVPQCAQSSLIRQVWRPVLPVTRKFIQRHLDDGVKLLHQIKDGSGFSEMRKLIS